MPEQLFGEQHRHYHPGPPALLLAHSRHVGLSMRHNHTELMSPKPTVARTGTWARHLEEVVESPGFQLPDDSQSLPPHTSGEGTTAAEYFHLSHPPPRFFPPPTEAQSLSSVKGSFKDIPSELRAKADAATQWYWYAPAVRNDP